MSDDLREQIKKDTWRLPRLSMCEYLLALLDRLDALESDRVPRPEAEGEGMNSFSIYDVYPEDAKRETLIALVKDLTKRAEKAEARVKELEEKQFAPGQKDSLLVLVNDWMQRAQKAEKRIAEFDSRYALMIQMKDHWLHRSEQAERQVKELETDKRRLDWLEENGDRIRFARGSFS